MLDLPPMTGRKIIIPIHPAGSGDAPPQPDRRRLLQLMAASAALAGTGCSGPPQEEIRPYVKAPEDVLPGQPSFYATTLLRQGYGFGALVESNMGRPTKVEGNPRHPASLGGTDLFAQAAVLDFWDPDRSQTPRRGGDVVSWSAAESLLAERAGALAKDGGAGLRVLTGTLTSPSWIAAWRELLRHFPAARRHCWEALHDDGAREAAQLAYGRPVDTVLHPDRARIILAVGADPLGEGPAWVAQARRFAELRRDPRRPSRLYVVDIAATLTGANADERVSLPPAMAERMLWRIAGRLGVLTEAPPPDPATQAWEEGLVAALRRHRGQSLVIAGRAISPETRALVHLMNAVLGNVGRTVDTIAPVEFEPQSHASSLAALCGDMRAGHVDTLLILGANPVYDAPAGLGFAEALAGVRHTVHAGQHRDETALRCAWHLPLAHEFEHWGDARAFDGTASVVQPLMRPLYGARSSREILAMLGVPAVSDYEAVRAAVIPHAQGAGEDAERAWRSILTQGVVPGSAAAPLRLPPPRRPPRPSFEVPPLSVVFVPDPSVGDGRHANNGWLQELPRPLTTLTWDNAAHLAPETARELGLEDGRFVDLEIDSRLLRIPVCVLPGQAPATLAVPLGYGRWAAGRVGNGVGFDAYRVKPAGFVAPALLTLRPERHDFARRQPETSMAGRPLARRVTVADAARTSHAPSPAGSLYPRYDYPTYAWAMSIDLNACIGCGACTIACQAENNIPVVGKEEVMRGRAMHWIRVDRWFDDARPAGPMQFQPVPCMHCEDAPCEPVCPVGAAIHDSEGLNVQVYNRCIGTRYCSNNCPYKVRRFNFLQYSNTDEESLKAAQNPEVTVRRRGVMEKCNYCLQRITRARIAAEEEGRRIADGEVVTACEAACPTRAIVFGDLNTAGSRVSLAKESPLDYAMLEELNTRPRTTYVARVVIPDPALEQD
ncbi:MAG: 4Fe-4S dicluster domain-containing protein [Ignavibacteria bacterium]